MDARFLLVKYAILGKDAVNAARWQIHISDTVTGRVHGNHIQTYGSHTGRPVR